MLNRSRIKRERERTRNWFYVIAWTKPAGNGGQCPIEYEEKKYTTSNNSWSQCALWKFLLWNYSYWNVHGTLMLSATAATAIGALNESSHFNLFLFCLNNNNVLFSIQLAILYGFVLRHALAIVFIFTILSNVHNLDSLLKIQKMMFFPSESHTHTHNSYVKRRIIVLTQQLLITLLQKFRHHNRAED